MEIFGNKHTHKIKLQHQLTAGPIMPRWTLGSFLCQPKTEDEHLFYQTKLLIFNLFFFSKINVNSCLNKKELGKYCITT